MDEYEVVWSGGILTEAFERDYADYCGEGWDLIWEPTSPLTTPWWKYAAQADPDPDQYVSTAIMRRGPRRKATRVLKDWAAEYGASMSQFSTGRGHGRTRGRNQQRVRRTSRFELR